MSRELERFRGAIARRFGLELDDSKQSMLAEVLQRRLDSTRLASEIYLAQLEAEPPSAGELRELAVELTVGETSFFRTGAQFRALIEIALPARIAARDNVRALRMLSAGCASGEEAYSLAIAVRERGLPSGWDVSIRGVDLNRAALAKAERARYSAWALRETPPEVQRRWFRAHGREYVLDAAIYKSVRFEERNLVADDPELWPEAAYDIVFCRNTIMYFGVERQRQVIARITRALAPGGYLFLGYAETLRGLSHDYHLCHTHDTFYYQRKRGASPGQAAQPASPASGVTETAVEAGSWVEAVQRASERIRALTDRERGDQPTRATEPGDARSLDQALDLLAADRFADALAHVPAGVRDGEALLLRAVLLAHSGRLDAARGACGELLALDELNAGAHYVLALCHEGAHDRQRAIEHDQVASYLDPSFAMPRVHLGLMARRAGDRETARRELGHALALVQREDASRLLLFGGGFSREALVALCRAELAAAGGTP